MANALKILQLTDQIGSDQLERAYDCSRRRYLRLSSRGPLRYYRNDLLSALEIAYSGLKNPTPKISSRPLGLLARTVRQAANRPPKAPVKSAVKGTSILPDKSSRLPADLDAKSSRNSTATSHETAQIEDKFCLEVIYRLEGDIIRFDARRELLEIARNWSISLFRANMLLAQIVESVRQNKLYKPTPEELMDRIKIRENKTRRKPFIITAIMAALLVVIAEVLLVYYCI